MTQKQRLLDGFVIADFGVGMSAALAAKFLADNGARVVRCEPDGGDPFYDYYGAYEVWRRGAEKLSGSAKSREAVNALLTSADACILGGEDYPGLARPFEAEALSAAHPKLVVLEITGNPHGVDGDKRPSTDLLAQARSGLCYEHFSTKPINMAFEPASYGAALQGLCALLAALYERQGSGRGQIVRTSLLEGALTWATQIWADVEKPTVATGAQPKDLHPLIFRCADGVYIHLVLGSAGSKYKLYQVLGIDDPTVKPTDSGMPSLTDGPRNFFGNIDLLSSHVARFQSDKLLNALWEAGLPVEVVMAPGGCWTNPQVQHNNLIDTDPDGTRHVGNPVISRVSLANAKPEAKTSDRPLGGVRVIDFGAYVAGPQASLILTDLGAEVIKVEPVSGDPSRAMARSYMSVNRGKKGLALDLKSKTGVAIAQKLAVSADVVTNNFRSGVSARLGIDPKTLHALRPDLIVLESPGYGVEGPMAQRAAFDLVMQAVCGHEMKASGEGNDPFWNRTYMVDFTGGMVGALGLLSALNYRARTGNGVSLEAPLLNGGVFLLSELIQRADGSWHGLRPLNAAQTGYSPYEALYQTSDGWLAIVARGAKAEQALLRTLGISSPGSAPADAIARAVAARSTKDLSAALEQAGVWTEPCRANAEKEILSDPAYLARGTVRKTRHKAYGTIRDIGCLYTFSRSRVGTDMPIHDLGEHTPEILASLKFQDKEIKEFLEQGVAANG